MKMNMYWKEPPWGQGIHYHLGLGFWKVKSQNYWWKNVKRKTIFFHINEHKLYFWLSWSQISDISSTCDHNFYYYDTVPLHVFLSFWTCACTMMMQYLYMWSKKFIDGFPGGKLLDRSLREEKHICCKTKTKTTR